MPATHAAFARALLAGGYLALAMTVPAVAAPLRLLVYPVPGLFDELEDGQIGGPGGTLVAKIGRVADLPYEAAALPIARAWQAIQAQPMTCVVGMTRTPEREPRFQWVAPISRGDFIVYGRADSAPVAAELTALRGKAVVVLRETAPARELRELGIAAQETNSTISALRMLQAGRVDYWYAHQLVAEAVAGAAGGPPIKPLFSTVRLDGYLACNLEVPAATIDKLRTGLQRLRRNGDLAAFGLH